MLVAWCRGCRQCFDGANPLEALDAHECPTPIARGVSRAAHGTPRGYREGCRCTPCRVAWNEYRREHTHARQLDTPTASVPRAVRLR